MTEVCLEFIFLIELIMLFCCPKSEGVPRADLAAFVRSYILKKYGKKKLVDQQLRGVVSAVLKNFQSSMRIRLFGRLAGVIYVNNYDPAQCDLVLALLRLLFPNTEKLKKAMEAGEGKCTVPLYSVMKAVNTVFPPRAAVLAQGSTGARTAIRTIHFLALDKELREKLQQAISSILDAAPAGSVGASPPAPSLQAAPQTKVGSTIRVKGGRDDQICVDSLLEVCHEAFAAQNARDTGNRILRERVLHCSI